MGCRSARSGGGAAGLIEGHVGARIEVELNGLSEVKLTSADLLADLRPLLSWNLDAHVVGVW